MDKGEEVSVLFSGGSDSALAAALCCQRFRKVHLLTFHHSGMRHEGKSKINVERLQDKFGKDKIQHRLIDIEEPFRRLYSASYFRDLLHYGVFLAPATCNICQLAMHTQTILYSLENGIRFACDGYKREKAHVYIVMAQEGQRLLTNLYKEYGISYFSPVYGKLRTDWELHDLGITPKRNIKFPYEKLDYEAQHSCFHGILTNAYLLGYYYQLHDSPSRRWIDYFSEKVEAARTYIQKHVDRNSV